MEQKVIPIILNGKDSAERMKEITDRLETGIQQLFDSVSSVHSAGITACKIGKYPDRRTFSFLSVTSSPYFRSYLLDERCVRHACILRNT